MGETRKQICIIHCYGVKNANLEFILKIDGLFESTRRTIMGQQEKLLIRIGKVRGAVNYKSSVYILQYGNFDF